MPIFDVKEVEMGLESIRTMRMQKRVELEAKTVLKNKEPTTTYKMQLANAEHLALGDYVKVSLPSLPSAPWLPGRPAGLHRLPEVPARRWASRAGGSRARQIRETWRQALHPVP